MSYRRPTYLSFLAAIHSTLMFAAIYPLIGAIMEYKSDKFLRFSASGALILIPILLSLALVHKIRHFLLFSAVGIAVSTMTALFAELANGFGSPTGKLCRMWTFIFSVTVFLIRLNSQIRYGRLKRDFMDFHGRTAEFTLRVQDVSDVLTHPSFLHWIWFSILYILGMTAQFNECLYIQFWMVFTDIFVCLIYRYFDAVCSYIDENKKVAHLPLSAMKKIHRTTGLIAAFVLLLFMLPAVLFGHEFVFNPSIENSRISADEIMIQQNEDSFDLSEILPEGETFSPPEWVIKLMNFLGVVLILIFAIEIIRALLKWLRKIGFEFAAEDETDETVFLMSEPSDSIRNLIRRRTKNIFSNEQKIRRRYKKTIRRATKGTPQSWATPSELEETAGLLGSEEINALHDSYEQVRYGNNNTLQASASRSIE